MRLCVIKRFGRKFFMSKNEYFSVFWTPWKNPFTDMSETYRHVLPSEALRPAVFGAKQHSAVFAEIC